MTFRVFTFFSCFSISRSTLSLSQLNDGCSLYMACSQMTICSVARSRCFIACCFQSEF